MASSKGERKQFLISIVLMLFYFFTKMTCSTRFDNKYFPEKKLLNRHLKIVTANFPPAIVILRNSTGHVIEYEGLLYQHLLFISQSLGFTFDIFPVAENTNGVKLQNGKWTGNIGTLLRGEADLALGPFAISLERYEVIDFAGMIGGDDTSMLVKYPRQSVSRSSAVDVFSLQVWIGFLISTTAVATFAGLLIYLNKKKLDMQPFSAKISNTYDVIFYMLATITSQGGYFRSGHKSIGTLAVTWCFAAFVFVNSYNSTLISYMSITFQRPEINSFDDLANSKIYKAAVLEGSIQDIDISAAKKGPLKLVGDKLRQCSDCRLQDLDMLVIKVLLEDHFVALQPSSMSRKFLQKYSSERNNCRLTMAQEKLVWKPFFFALPKLSPYGESISLESMWWLDLGLQNYWFIRKEIYPKQCLLVYNKKGIATKRLSSRLTLELFYIPFIILFTGYLLAILVFFCENTCRHHYITRS